MNTYLTVGASRIQTYLARSKRLRAHARASGRIADRSSHFSARNDDQRAALAELLGDDGDGWRFNDALGKVDGVISLVHSGPLPHDEVKAVAERVLSQLRGEWPGADLSAVWGSGAAYTDAYREQIGPALARNDVLFAAPPASELPLARPCELCEHDAAVDRRRVVDEERELCADCVSRGVDLPGGTAGRRGTMMEEVARYGDPEEANHVGTIAMDGNAIGGLFEALAEVDQELGHQLSKALPEAVEGSLAAASTASEVPYLVHVSGGDDVLVSVPAGRAWTFARQLLQEFTRAVDREVAPFRERLSTLTGGRVDRGPSASAGLVIHHVTYPFGLVVEAAYGRLAEAKQEVRGAESSIAWTDLTIDGDRPPAWRRPWPAAELEQASDKLSRLRDLPKSARYAAARLIDPEQPATSWCRLIVHIQRFERGHDPVRAALSPFLEDARPTNDPEPTMTRLLDALAITRWW